MVKSNFVHELHPGGLLTIEIMPKSLPTASSPLKLFTFVLIVLPPMHQTWFMDKVWYIKLCSSSGTPSPKTLPLVINHFAIATSMP